MCLPAMHSHIVIVMSLSKTSALLGVPFKMPLCYLLFTESLMQLSLYSLKVLVRHSDFHGIHFLDKGPLSGELRSESWEKYRLCFPLSALSGEKSTGMLYSCEAPKSSYELKL